MRVEEWCGVERGSGVCVCVWGGWVCVGVCGGVWVCERECGVERERGGRSVERV